MKKYYSGLLIAAAVTMLAACGQSSSDNADGSNDSTSVATDSAAVAEVVADTPTEGTAPEQQAPVDDSTLTADDEQAVFEVIKAIHTTDNNKKYATGELRRKLDKGGRSIGVYDYGTDGLIEWEIVPNSLKITSFDPATGNVKYTLKVKCIDNDEDGGSWVDTHNETATVVKENGQILLTKSSTLYTWS